MRRPAFDILTKERGTLIIIMPSVIRDGMPGLRRTMDIPTITIPLITSIMNEDRSRHGRPMSTSRGLVSS